MAKTIGSFDLASLKYLRDDVTQYFWFESDSSSAWGSGAHVTLYPESQFTNPSHANYMKGQNIIMNTDGFSIRNGALPMMVIDNDSLDFNAVDTSLGTYTTMATFGLTGATIGQSGGAHSIIDANGQRFYANDGTTQLANIGYGLGTDSGGGTDDAPYYTFGTRSYAIEGQEYDSTKTYKIGDLCLYDDGNGYKTYVCAYDITTPEPWDAYHWKYYIGNYSHAEGYLTTASGFASHAEGYAAKAIGYYSHAEGFFTKASEFASHAEGNGTIASGMSSHAEGAGTEASGHVSHAGGRDTIASRRSQTAIGEYNIKDTTGIFPGDRGDYALIIGNGTSTNARSNALTVDWDGRVQCGDYSGIFKSIFDIFYPIGSYYETSLASAIPSGSSTPTATDLAELGVTWFDPQYAWGGTWVLETAGRFHISAGTGYAVGATGGWKDAAVISHYHNPSTTSEYFVCNAYSEANNTRVAYSGSGNRLVDGLTSTGTSSFHHRKATQTVGESGTNRNLPPYVAVNRWHRTA